MKIKVVLSVLLGLAVIIFYFSKPKANENEVGNFISKASLSDTTFRIGQTNIGVQTDFDFLAPLKCNLWHRLMNRSYGGRTIPVGWTDIGAPHDSLYTEYVNYASDVRGILERNSGENYKSYSMRPKLDMLAYSQRSDYQCEHIPASTDNVDWWYAFDYSDYGTSNTFDSNVWVRHLKLMPSEADPPGYVVKQLRANREQVDNRELLFNDTNYSWYVKPRMRIDSNFANNPINWNKRVCRIDVINYDGDTIEKADILVSNFLNDSDFYNGSYKEEDFWKNPYPNQLFIKYASILNPRQVDSGVCKFDIQVYWYGECELWLDYVRVDNEWANDLFSSDPNNINHIRDLNWIEWEAREIASTSTTYNFFEDELEYNMMPAIAYLNEKIHTHNPNLSINSVVNITFITPNLNINYGAGYNRCALSNEHIKNNILKWGMNEVMVDIYPLYGTKTSMKWFNFPQYIPKTLGNQIDYNPGAGILAYSAPIALYEQNLDSVINRHYILPLIQTKAIAGLLNYYYPIHIITTNQLYYPGNEDSYSQREPTNEELGLLNYLAVSYSAKAITQYAYWSFGKITDTTYYQRGLIGDGMETVNTDTSKSRRIHNAYGQDKWTKVCQVNEKLQKWGHYLVTFNESLTNSYNYRNLTDRNALYSNSYFSRFATLRPGSGQIDCNEDFTPEVPSNWLFDCQYNTYLQIATFKNTEPNTEYFMVVNRRCSPYKNDNNDDSIGGRRKIQAYIKSNYFDTTIAHNWSIVDCEVDTTVAIFPAHNPGYVNLDWFMPGEGRLYKIVPTVFIGGTLVCNENISGGNFTLQDTLYTNGHNLTIGFGTTINFTDSACIIVNGGSFTCGDVSQPTHERNIIFKGVTGNSWSGLSFNDCDLVNINSAQFENVKGPSENTNFAVKMINCNTVNINNCTFTNADQQTSGAVGANFSGTGSEEINFYIAGNTFNMNSSDKTIVSVIANAECTVPVMLDNNIFTSTSNSATAIYLSFINGIEVGGNAIVGFNKGIEMHYCNIDVIGNSITSTTGNNGAKGIDAQDLSSANLTSTGTLRTGGLNIFDNAGQNINNIYVNDSYFYLDKGKNVFGVISGSNSYHLKGYFPGDTDGNPIDETANCFRVDNVAVVESNLPVKEVKWRETENNIDFNFFSYDCSTVNECDEMIVYMGNSVYDTICIIPGGSGGGVPSVQTVTPKKMYDSLCVLMRLRNFPQAKTKCYQLLTTFPDSSLSLNAVSKLYYLAVTRDTSTANITECKTFLNTLILNHPNNLPLVRKCNYYVQKCKVKLKQYQSAKTGFQQIIQQNPYSYEALLASWDYAATNLLDSLNGPGGVSSTDVSPLTSHVSPFTIDEFSSDDILSQDFDAIFEKIDNLLFNDDDKDAFTKEQRKAISTSVVTALSDSKTKSKNHIETLKKQSEAGNTDAVVELKVINTLKEVVKIKKPKTIHEHIKSVNKDIQKLNSVKNETVKKVTGVIPETYNLSQNYPNPFNPVTKINYELPKDGRVKLVIYDILGREIKTLVNELKQAGRYTVEFNGNNFASGVYFYRIQVEGGKSYTAVKKMVLVK